MTTGEDLQWGVFSHLIPAAVLGTGEAEERTDRLAGQRHRNSPVGWWFPKDECDTEKMSVGMSAGTVGTERLKKT